MLMLSLAVSATAQTTYEIAQFDGSLNPDPASVWVVNVGDGGALNSQAFAGLRDAIMSAASPVSVQIVGTRPLSHGAFQACENLASVDLSQTPSLADGSFYKSTVQSVKLSNNITKIGRDAFRGCSSLTAITLSDEPRTETKLEVLGSAFQDCKLLKTLSLPATFVDSYAFSGCYAIEVLELPLATELGANLLGSCNKLTRVDMSAPGAFYFFGEGNESGEKVFANMHYPHLKSNCVVVLNEDKAGKKGRPKADLESSVWLTHKGEPIYWKSIELVQSAAPEKGKKGKK